MAGNNLINPTFSDAQIERLKRFGSIENFKAGDLLIEAGKSPRGIFVLLSGEATMAAHNGLEQSYCFEEKQGPGQFIGDSNQLLDQGPALFDSKAVIDGEAIVITPANLRRMMTQEAHLGELVMLSSLARHTSLIESRIAGPTFISPSDNKTTDELCGFLSSNGLPYTLRPPTDSGAAKFLAEKNIDNPIYPVIVMPGGEVLQTTSEIELAVKFGLRTNFDPDKCYDLVIIGAGPGGLSAAIAAGSEGLSTLVCDAKSFGGQAGASARIENYPGFAAGTTGQSLMNIFFAQAIKFGVQFAIPATIDGIEPLNGDGFMLHVKGDGQIHTKTVILALGASYIRPNIPGREQAEEAGNVHYIASYIEKGKIKDQHVVLIGGGNSAGQAAVNLSESALKVSMLVRSDLSSSMSSYLIERIESQPNIAVRKSTQVDQITCDENGLRCVHCVNSATGEETTEEIRHLFIFTGASPATRFLEGMGIALNEKGYVLTGTSIPEELQQAGYKYNFHETNVPGIFAIGDVRYELMKRAVVAVGEGTVGVAEVHQYLAYLREQNHRRAGASEPIAVVA